MSKTKTKIHNPRHEKFHADSDTQLVYSWVKVVVWFAAKQKINSPEALELELDIQLSSSASSV